jgi:hypothetical protein
MVAAAADRGGGRGHLDETRLGTFVRMYADSREI